MGLRLTKGDEHARGTHECARHEASSTESVPLALVHDLVNFGGINEAIPSEARKNGAVHAAVGPGRREHGNHWDRANIRDVFRYRRAAHVSAAASSGNTSASTM
jgi:hypothetical protein